MFLVYLNKFKELLKKNLLAILITIFAFYINKIYANLGVFPIDTFFHFDAGFNVMKGYFPIKDYWIVSGIIPDLLQAFFFKIFGVSWSSHVMHASIFNSFISLATFFLLQNIGLNKIYSFFYSVCFSILAYPISGTPFVDHHAIFLSLIGIYFFIFSIKTEKNYFWSLMMFFFAISFLSKQVPISYIFILVSALIVFYSLLLKNIDPLKHYFFSLFLILIFIYILLIIFKISFQDFLIQYIFYPPSIGTSRFQNIIENFSFIGLIDEFKFIFIPLSILFYLNFKRVLKNKNYLKNKNFFFFINIFIFSGCLIFHQTITLNQNLTYFLSIILFAFLHNDLLQNFKKRNKLTTLFILFAVVFITVDIHLSYNETRKFHELRYVDFKKSKDASVIDNKFKNLRWITPSKKDEVSAEIEFIKETIEKLKNDPRKKMIITHYQFLSSLLNEYFFQPSRSYTLNGASFPLKDNKFFEDYKIFFNKKVKNNNIDVIYLIDNKEINDRVVTEYLKSGCIKDTRNISGIKTFEINKNC